jgi:glutamate---cysteine ligase / carboxylate-amine ligase
MTAINLDAAETGFATSTDFTVGLEEEFAILDPQTLDMVPRFDELQDAATASDDVLAASIAGELIASEVEIRSGRGLDIHDAIARQRDARRRLFKLAEQERIALGATGTHPWADYRKIPNIDTEHYRRVVDGLQYVARRNNTFSLHAHVGIQGADRAIAVTDRLRGVLPTLLAVSANSPWVDGIDSGLHSVRTQTFTKSFPRCGIPDVFGTWAEYREYVELLARTNSIVEYTQVWWSVRPHVSFGTVEVRICDVQATASESEALIELIVACVAQAARDVDEGRPHTHPAPRLIEENMWRAIRYGRDGKLLDLDRLVEESPAAAVERLLTWTAPIRAELGIGAALPAANGAQRQRAMIAAGLSREEIYATSVAETRQTYAQPQEVPS